MITDPDRDRASARPELRAECGWLSELCLERFSDEMYVGEMRRLGAQTIVRSCCTESAGLAPTGPHALTDARTPSGSEPADDFTVR